MKRCLVFLILITATTHLVLGQKYDFLIGTYTKKTSEGIYFASFDVASNSIKLISHSDKIHDPSYVSLTNDEKMVYSVSESDGGAAVALSFDRKTGKFTTINTVSSGGIHPCHIELDKTQNWAFIANYTGGSLSVLPIKTDRSLEKPIQTIQHYGNGPNKSRQEKPHVHSVNISPDNKNLFVADLGVDKLFNYKFNEKTGSLSLQQELKVTGGSGPRHFTFHPNGKFAYLIQELTGSVSVYECTKGNLRFIEEVSTLPINFEGKNASADIHISPNGKYLYGSNRFYDTIVCFKIDSKSGKLKQVSQTRVNGKTPRNFAITKDGNYLFAANQDSDNIVVFKIDKKSGSLTPTGCVATVSMPVCIKFLNSI